jgi:hypothetical protein
MQITQVSYSHTRQVEPYHPISFHMTANLIEGEDPDKAAAMLQELVIRVLYRNAPQMRDELIAKLLPNMKQT